MERLRETYRKDFDRIAHFGPKPWNHNLVYHEYLLDQLPARCDRVLDLGCGTGSFSRPLSERADTVLGIDLSPEMVRVAATHSTDHPNIEYQVSDFMESTFSSDSFDAVASLTTLHHLPLEEVLERIKPILRPGGVLLVLDIPAERNLWDLAVAAAAAPVNLVLMARHRGSLRQDPEEKAAWLEHGSRDRYSTMKEVRRICRAILPGARLRRHLLWRYSIVWHKPPGASAPRRTGSSSRAKEPDDR